MPEALQRIRSVLYWHLTTQVAQAAGIDLVDLHQIVAGQYRPTERELRKLQQVLELPDA